MSETASKPLRCGACSLFQLELADGKYQLEWLWENEEENGMRQGSIKKPEAKNFAGQVKEYCCQRHSKGKWMKNLWKQQKGPESGEKTGERMNGQGARMDRVVYLIRRFIKRTQSGAGRGSMVRNTRCPCREPGISFQHLHADLPSSLTPVLGDPVHSSGLYRYQAHTVNIHTHRSNIYTHNVKQILKKNF